MTNETLAAVHRDISNRGIVATVERNGSIFVEVPTNPGLLLIFGSQNATFDCNVVDREDYGLVQEITSDIASDSTDVSRIADFIACTYTEGCEV